MIKIINITMIIPDIIYPTTDVFRLYRYEINIPIASIMLSNIALNLSFLYIEI